MGLPRSARIAVLTSLAVVAAVVLFALGSSGHPTRGASAAQPPSTGGSGRGPGGARSSTTDPAPTTTTSTTLPAHDPTYRIGQASLSVPAHNRAGAPVTIPTTVWYPQGGAGRTFPLVIFSPGYQIAPAVYDSLTEAWASAGYVVAEPVYPDTAPGSPQIEYDMINHPGELGQVRDALVGGKLAGTAAFEGLIDPSEVAVAGHSDGGDVSLAAAADTCCTMAGIRAAMILSGAEWAPFGGTYFGAGNPPLLAVQGARDTINPPGCSAQLYDGAAAPRFYLDLPAGTHKSPYLYAGPQQTVVEQVTTDFLDGYLKGMKPRLDQLTSAGDDPGVSQVTVGGQVPVTGTCPGAPGYG
ncbi:MAG TPA: hypothetical protein VFN68_15255 [Acidimicrobiales bacterium]|nr:hypothetical protein [Acidimicrobiales bacterium]